MANREKSFVTEWFLNRWLNEAEKSRPDAAENAVPPADAKSRHLPVRFMFGVNDKNVIVPIMHRDRPEGGATNR